MKDNMRNLREITNLVLKDIHVTEKLKDSTLKKCKRKKRLKLKPIYAIGIFTAIIVFTLIDYQYYYANFHNDIAKKYIYNNPIARVSIKALDKIIGKSTDTELKTTEDKSKKSIPSTENSSINSEISQNTKKDVDSNSNSTSDSNINNNNTTKDPQPKLNDNTEYIAKNENPEPEDEPITNPTEELNKNTTISPDMVSLANAQNYFGGTISMPSYIPENFKLTDIHIPEDIETEKIITIDYSSPENKYFKLTQSKKLSSSIPGEKVSINDEIQGYIYINNGSAASDSPIVQIAWTKDNIEYTLYGNISKESIISIAESIN
ncbi:DUF4367 domain-containing protein [Clostridium sp. BJN0013]|uniref:DUF4367 domain-containing protein n=1 Tax=Clostridium sp. BJN0013 TaxID=3236840 RepID=UPI0034C60D47